MNSRIDSASDTRRLIVFAGLGLAQALIYAALAFGENHQGQPDRAVLLIVIAVALYFVALVTARPLSGKAAFAVAVALGVTFRALLFPEAPLLSDDYFRYLWDGLVQLRGVNPYRYAPADPALAGIDDALRAQVNHPEVRTIYPPVAQLIFLFGAWVSSGHVFVLKAFWLVCDVGIAVLLLRLLPPERKLQAWTVYVWSPLVIIEVAWTAHLDLLGVFPVVLAIYLATRSPVRSAGLGLAVAGSAMVKYFAVIFLPSAARRGRLPRVLVAFAAAILLLHIPYASAGYRTFEGLFTYAASWHFNAGLFDILTWLLSAQMAKLIAVAVVLFMVVGSVRNEWTLEKTVFWLTGTILILSPTVHPWYLLWMVPLVALRPNRAWLYLSGSVLLAYYGLAGFQAEGVWPEPWWIKLLIYGPFFVLLAADGWPGSWWQAAWETLRIPQRRR